MDRWFPKPWMLPLIVAALVAPIVVGFAVGGPALGIGLGIVVGLALVVIGYRSRGRPELGGEWADPDGPVVVLTATAIESGSVARRLGEGADDRSGVFVVTPSRAGALQRWLSDTDPAHRDAEAVLDRSAKTIESAGLQVQTRVGDDDPLQALVDTIRVRGASRIVLVTGPDADAAQVERVRDGLGREVEVIEAS